MPFSLHVPSRSEGIETKIGRVFVWWLAVYTCLPVRRELKPATELRPYVAMYVYTCLPVRRESKLLHPLTKVTGVLTVVYTCLPARRESKHTSLETDNIENIVYTCLPVRRESKLAVYQKCRRISVWTRLHVPSRSEGIETFQRWFLWFQGFQS